MLTWVCPKCKKDNPDVPRVSGRTCAHCELYEYEVYEGFVLYEWYVDNSKNYRAYWLPNKHVTRVYRLSPCDCCGIEDELMFEVQGIDFNVKPR